MSDHNYNHATISSFIKCVHIVIHKSIFVVSYLRFFNRIKSFGKWKPLFSGYNGLDMFRCERPKIIIYVDGSVTIIHRICTSQKEDYPEGIPECGTDALRFALCAYTAQG